MQEHIETFRDGFPQGYTEVTTLSEPSGIAFGVLKSRQPFNPALHAV